MKITKEELKQLIKKGSVEVRVISEGKEFWEILEISE